MLWYIYCSRLSRIEPCVYVICDRGDRRGDEKEQRPTL
jgi:hypothetical protein